MVNELISLRELWQNYRSEVFFGLILSALVALGHWLFRFIPVDLLNNVVIPFQHGGNIAVCLVGAWLLFRHSDGLRIRKASAYALVAWSIAEACLVTQEYVFHLPVLRIGSDALNAYLLFICNFLGWILLIYPTETLRPGWLNTPKALLQLLPLAAMVALDYVVPYDLRWIIFLYPVMLFILVLTHIRAYRIWCEQNYSSMEHIDAQWIVRYLVMLQIIGGSYLYVALSDNPGRVVTQNILLFFFFVYATEQILFRCDPWVNVQKDKVTRYQVPDTKECFSDEAEQPENVQPDSVQILEQWMETEKPYLHADFQLMDLRAVLPMNRTYLSQLINSTYGCTFFQYVNRYRIEEAKRLMQENPDMKMTEIATLSGFSSPNVFSRVFSRETGVSPKEWSKKIHSA
jgi:AraC-like DNA-binding protein